MHMADALISPAVGATAWAATAATTVYCARAIRREADPAKVPLMGVLGAFVFAAQMVNFTIPGTGSSGHLGGGLLLAILLGPEAAFLVIASVLTIQALFFADGGLLALGANIFNLGVIPAFVAHPLVYRPIAGTRPTKSRLAIGSVVAAVVAVALGAMAVVAETTLSGVSELPFDAFVAVMVPIHLVIGVAEGLVTAAVVLFVAKAQPEILDRAVARRSLVGVDLRVVTVAIASAALIAGGVLALWASENPDGLEWSIERTAGQPELESRDTGAHGISAAIQELTALMPGYERKEPETEVQATREDDGGSSAVGAAVTVAIVAGVGWLLSRRSRRRSTGP